MSKEWGNEHKDNKHFPRTLTPNSNHSQLISWSKNGFIAYANKRSHLLLTYLENIDGRNWQFSPPQNLNSKLDSSAREIALIRWSNLSTDLAVADIHGNIYILLAGVGLLQAKTDSSTSNGANTSNGTNANSNGTNSNGGSESGSPPAGSPSYELTSYNHMEMIYRDIMPSSSCSRAVVAFKWLNIEKPQIVNKLAVLDPSSSDTLKYTYSVGQYQPHGLTHPISTKQACVVLRRNGEFVMYYQGEHKVEYHKTSVQLSDELVYLTLGSIGFTNDSKMVVAAYDTLTNRIVVFSVSVDWGFMVESAKRQKQDPHFHTPKEAQKAPKLTLEKVQTIVPLPIIGDQPKEDKKNETVFFGALASIDIVSVDVEKESKPEILITYTSKSSLSNKSSTTIYRYHLIEEQELISETFADLGLRKGCSSEGTKSSSLALQDVLTRPGHIKSITTSLNEAVVLLHYAGGRMDMIDRTSMTVVGSNSEDTPSSISSIFDAGYELPPINHPTMAVSPNLTSAVYLEDDKLVLALAEKKRYASSKPTDLQISAVGFAYRHAYSCYTNTCSDDLVILIQKEVERLQELGLTNSEAFINTIVTESHRAINFELDKFGKESVDKLLSNPPLQKLMSLQLVLGEMTPLTVASDIAWIVLNLRSCSFGIMFLLSSIYRQISKKKPTEDSLHDSVARGECIMSLIGNIKWLVDLMVYLNQELLQLSNNMKGNPFGGHSKVTLKSSCVLPVILSKVPRLFLMYALLSIGKTHEILKKLHKDLDESNKLFTPMKESLNRCFSLVNNSPITLSLFENFLRECDTMVSKELAAKSAGKERNYNLKIEQALVCHGEVSEDLLQISRTIIEKHNSNINRDMKVSELYFYEVDWLNIGINRPAHVESNGFVPRLHFSSNECIDALRKFVIGSPKKAKTRKCTRCRSVSLVSDPRVFDESTNIGLWTMVFQRTCICGNSWVNID